MKLAWQNIIHDRARFSVTVLGVCFCRVLDDLSRESFGRLSSSSIAGLLMPVIRTSGSLLEVCRRLNLEPSWTVASGKWPPVYRGWWRLVACAWLFAVYRTPNGTQQVVALVGADPNVGKRFPVPNMTESAGGTSPEAVLYDVSDRKQMDLTSLAGRSGDQSSPCEHRARD